MIRILFGFLMIITLCNCFTFGKVGYLVPANDDSQKMSDEIVAENCDFVVTSVLDDTNSKVRRKGLSEVSDVGIQFTGTNCVQIKKLQK